METHSPLIYTHDISSHAQTHKHRPKNLYIYMENRLIRRPKTQQMGCKKHPKHRQSPGVCSICLRERLSKLPATSRSSNNNMVYSCSSSSSLSSLSSQYSSSEASPVHHHGFSMGSEALRSGKNGLMKSRSVAFMGRMREGEDGKKRGGFWSKLLIRSRSNKIKKDGELVHSRTMRERVISRVH